MEVDPDRIIVTSGSSPAMLLLFAALLDPGDEVILSDPCYACYPNIVEFVDGKPVEVPVFEEDGFSYRPRDIEESLGPRTKAIIINSPSNPTGNLLEPEVMREIAALSGRGLYVVSDEIYHGLVYESREHSILEFTDHAFVLDGFSKLYAMTGWRLGYPHRARGVREAHPEDAAEPVHLRQLLRAAGRASPPSPRLARR